MVYLDRHPPHLLVNWELKKTDKTGLFSMQEHVPWGRFDCLKQTPHYMLGFKTQLNLTTLLLVPLHFSWLSFQNSFLTLRSYLAITLSMMDKCSAYSIATRIAILSSSFTHHFQCIFVWPYLPLFHLFRGRRFWGTSLVTVYLSEWFSHHRTLLSSLFPVFSS